MTQSGDIYAFGPFRLDLASRTLLRDDEAVALTAKAFDTLAILVRHHDRVVEKDELVKLVWPDSFVSDDSLTHSVSVLRRALGDDSAQPVYIATIPRRGYRFTAPVVVEHTTSLADGAESCHTCRRHCRRRRFVAGRGAPQHASTDTCAPVVGGFAPDSCRGRSRLRIPIRAGRHRSSLAPDATIRFVQDAPPGTADRIGRGRLA